MGRAWNLHPAPSSGAELPTLRSPSFLKAAPGISISSAPFRAPLPVSVPLSLGVSPGAARPPFCRPCGEGEAQAGFLGEPGTAARLGQWGRGQVGARSAGLQQPGC